MAERPIILFAEPDFAERAKRTSGFSKIQMPTFSRQSSRLAPKMAALNSTLITLQQTAVGIEPEKALVFELAQDVQAFYTAVKHLGDGIELIFDAPDDIAVNDDFYVIDKDKETGEVVRREDKHSFGGKVYCVLTNAGALREMLRLWELYIQDPQTQFPRGKTGLRNVFDCLIDIHEWSYKERIEETGVLDAWSRDLLDSELENVKCEIELFFRSSPAVRQQREEDLTERISTLGGMVLGRSVIAEISYHAILAELPRGAIDKVIKKDTNISLLTAEQIMFFRPVGQVVKSIESTDVTQSINIPYANNIQDEAIIALFDGLPQENHPFLNNRLIVDDPEDYESLYTVHARKHGTSMASLIALGDLSETVHQATHKIYVRPIMKPTQVLHSTIEEVPNDVLLVDKIHEAVRRLYETDAGAVASTVTVKVINLSIGISYRQFDRTMSPLARLLDWLSYKYHVLFIVSAGNHDIDINIGINFEDFAVLDMSKRDEKIIEFINDNAYKCRLLSPSESINALTIGATFDDGTTLADNPRFLLPCSDGMLSPISAIGKGINNSIKPDLIYPGGRNTIMENPRSPEGYKWRTSSLNEPGTVSAAPFAPGDNMKVAYSFGTSNSAAMISHETFRCYDTLLEVFAESSRDIPEEHIALLIKTMLVHGAEWGDLKGKIAQTLGFTNRSQYQDVIHKFIGYGKPNIDRAIECAKKRITLISYGELNNEAAHLYDLPLPFDFSTERVSRRLTATLSYFTPIVASKQQYRSAHLWFAVENGKKHLLDKRVDASDKAVSRGSVQHEIFENDEIVVWGEDDGVQIKVNCRAAADERLTDAIPYALMVSFEINSDIDVDVYTKISELVKPRITV